MNGLLYLDKEERQKVVNNIFQHIFTDIKQGTSDSILDYSSKEDTYIREKTAYQSIGKIYHAEKTLRKKILELLDSLFESEQEKVRQTAINAAGEIGMREFAAIEYLPGERVI